MLNKFQSKYQELKRTTLGLTALLLFMGIVLVGFESDHKNTRARADTLTLYFNQNFTVEQVSLYHPEIGHCLVTVRDKQGETFTAFSKKCNLKVGQKVNLRPISLGVTTTQSGIIAAVKQ